MISGMGSGLERGVLNLQQGIIQSGLMKEREAMEQERLRLTFAHDEQMFEKRSAADRALQQERMGGDIVQRSLDRQHAEELQGKKIESERGMHQERLGAGLTEKGMGIEAAKEEKKAELAARKEEKATELTARKEEKAEDRKLEGRKLDIEAQHYKDWKEVYGKIAEARSEGRGTKADYSRLDMYKDFLVAQANAIRDQLKDPLVLPEDKARLQDELKQMDSELRTILGIEQRKAPASGLIKDRFKVPVKPAGPSTVPLQP